MGCVTSTSATDWESPVRGHIEAVTVGDAAGEKPPTLPPKAEIVEDRLGGGTFASARKPTTHEKLRMRKQFHQHYILQEKIGEGAQGQVHLATAVADGSEVAVKVIDLLKVQTSMANEIAIIKRVCTQPHCVKLHDVYREGAVFYLIMEKCEMTLLQTLESIPELTEHTLVPIITEMLLALDSIHTLLVVHRDIKPANILCSGENHTVKLCDFGSAQLLPDRNAKLKGIDGTLAFMSPEMIQLHDYDTQTDVWSLGVIAYIVLCGQLPYQPRHQTHQATKLAIAEGIPRPTFQPVAGLDAEGAQLSPPAVAFLRALLTRNPTARPTAAEALLLPWVANSQESGHSLRPAFRAAKQVLS